MLGFQKAQKPTKDYRLVPVREIYYGGLEARE